MFKFRFKLLAKRSRWYLMHLSFAFYFSCSDAYYDLDAFVCHSNLSSHLYDHSNVRKRKIVVRSIFFYYHNSGLINFIECVRRYHFSSRMSFDINLWILFFS